MLMGRIEFFSNPPSADNLVLLSLLMDPYLLFLDHGVVQVSLPLHDLRFAVQYFPLFL